MKKSVEILGLPVISITEGRELGMSKTLLVDAKNGTIAAITIEDEDWYRGVKLLPYSSVIAIGIIYQYYQRFIRILLAHNFFNYVCEKIINISYLICVVKMRNNILQYYYIYVSYRP